jgi:hypothetical protein
MDMEQWISIVRIRMCFSIEKLVEGWEFFSADNDYRWYLKGFGFDSLCIAFWMFEDDSYGYVVAEYEKRDSYSITI